MLLALADEYQTKKVKDRCEELMLPKVHAASSSESAELLTLADKYNLKRLLGSLVEHCRNYSYTAFVKVEGFSDLSSDTTASLLFKRVEELEGKAVQIQEGEAELEKVKAELKKVKAKQETVTAQLSKVETLISNCTVTHMISNIELEDDCDEHNPKNYTEDNICSRCFEKSRRSAEQSSRKFLAKLKSACN